VVSSRGNKYIMVVYEYDGNFIMAEPIKNRTTEDFLRPFKVMEQSLITRGIKLRLVRLDNEV
jgi:hypothetical protein